VAGDVYWDGPRQPWALRHATPRSKTTRRMCRRRAESTDLGVPGGVIEVCHENLTGAALSEITLLHGLID
jgi:hypothetical protein